MAQTPKELLAAFPLVLAPMEDVTDATYRALCRALGAELCVTEFIAAEQMIANSRLARRRAALEAGDHPTAIQIYGADPEALVRAARLAEAKAPAYLDINCGCWVPRIAGRGAGAGWLRKPAAMVEMARAIAAAVALPVTVKTRIGWGPESDMPIVDLARRLEDAGVAALTIHCRTAQQGYTGAASWDWARRAREVVAMPVIVNGDIASAQDALRALDETGCAGAMIGRAALEDPWIFGEARALLRGEPALPRPTEVDRIAVFRRVMLDNVAVRGELRGVTVTRRHVGLLGALRAELRPRLFATTELTATLDLLDAAEAALRERGVAEARPLPEPEPTRAAG